MSTRLVVRLVFGLIVIVAVGSVYYYLQVVPGLDDSSDHITSFEECVVAGNPVMESYPSQCRHGDATFVQDIGNEFEKADLIRVNVPRPTAKIASPLLIKGEARGFWFFEASFPVRLLDEDDNELAVGIMTAQIDPDAEGGAGWMTEDFVAFEGELVFVAPVGMRGNLIFERDNPSDLPENDDFLRVPVVIGVFEVMEEKEPVMEEESEERDEPAPEFDEEELLEELDDILNF